MFFDHLADFLSMGRHAPYVWSAYGISIGTIIMAQVAVRLRHRRLKRAFEALEVTP